MTMQYSVIYSSCTGNTARLAQTIREALPPEELIYFGPPCPEAPAAKTVFLGFWTDKGTCDARTAAFLPQLRDSRVFQFGTAGFGQEPAYFEKILSRVQARLDGSCTVLGTFMCQGRMPGSVRERYEKLKASPAAPPQIDMLLANFDAALSHPDEQDLKNLRTRIEKAV